MSGHPIEFRFLLTRIEAEYTDKKENQIFLKYKGIQCGAVAKSNMKEGFLIYEELRKYFPVCEEAVSHTSI